jgi:acetyl-CoA decarbonylase/synthase, CODH/ACS complex subunit delta
MSVGVPKTAYTGKIKEVSLGISPKVITVGGETSYPFYLFEGQMPNKPSIAMEIWDIQPEDWPEAAVEPFSGFTHNPVRWAKKCVNEYKAEMICLQLISIDPNGLNRDAEEAAQVVKNVADAIDTPIIVWGTGNQNKNIEVLGRVAEICKGRNLILGPVEAGDYKQISAVALAGKHTVIASTPIDINLAKQLNILLSNFGISEQKILIDPTVSSIGYGIEYCYSVMERIRIAGLVQQDEKLQFPIICNISKETWKIKEAKIPASENPKMGDARKRGILFEAVSAMSLLLAGADILIMRHPEAIRLVREMITDLGAS